MQQKSICILNVNNGHLKVFVFSQWLVWTGASGDVAVATGKAHRLVILKGKMKKKIVNEQKKRRRKQNENQRRNAKKKTAT